MIASSENGTWIWSEGVDLRSWAAGDCYGDSLFDIAGTVGADGGKSIGGRGIGGDG